jgi:hypothetical protein
MLNRRNRSVLFIVLALVITAILTFTFLPAVRASVESILTFNGVTVSVDQETGKLVVSGNMDAVVKQTDHYVTIKGENGEEAGAGITAAQVVESASVSDLLTSHPDLILPTVPADYSLQPQVEVVGGSMTFTWQNSSGHLITYQRSPATFEGGGMQGSQIVSSSEHPNIEQPIASDSQPTPEIHSGNGFISIGGKYNYSGPDITYNWVTGGYFNELIVMDTTLSEAELQAMLP